MRDEKVDGVWNMERANDLRTNVEKPEVGITRIINP